jgi:hypothetical protein
MIKGEHGQEIKAQIHALETGTAASAALRRAKKPTIV